jgi:hypothetical protein
MECLGSGCTIGSSCAICMRMVRSCLILETRFYILVMKIGSSQHSQYGFFNKPMQNIPKEIKMIHHSQLQPHKEPPPCRTWIWGQADHTERLIVTSLFSVEFSPIVTNAYILIFLFMSTCNTPNSLQQFNRPFCQCSTMLPMAKTKGNGTKPLYKAFNYAC